MKRYILSGVRPADNSFAFDYHVNLPNDIIELVSPQLYSSEHNNQTYWFGYQFKDGISSKVRSDFIHYIKGLNGEKPSEHELTQFLIRPMAELDKQINLQHIDCIVYPLSGRSELVRKLVSTVNRCTSHNTRRINFELVKSCPTDISFDWESFESENSDRLGYAQMCGYVKTQLIPKIHKLDYFSIAKNVKPKYRKYIKNFLTFADEKLADKFSALSDNMSILVIDDINTSGSTLDEILRILNDINNHCKIFIYTLIGN